MLINLNLKSKKMFTKRTKKRRGVDGVESADTKNLTQTVAAVAVSAGVLFLTVWVISKAWKSGQKTA